MQKSNLKRDIGSEDWKIEALIKQLREDKFLVPTFQREFVWEPANIVKLWDSETLAQLHASEPQADAVSSLAASPDGRTIVVGGWGGAVTFLDARTARKLFATRLVSKTARR